MFNLVFYKIYIHTYIIGHYNPSVRIIDLVSHTTYRLILYISDGTYSSTSNDRFFEKLFMAMLYISDGTYSLKYPMNDRFFVKLFMAILFALRVFARNLLRGIRRRKIFRILFWCVAWGSNPDSSSNKPTHYLIDHGNFRITYYFYEIRKLFVKLYYCR